MRITDILNQIDTGHIALPEFQRGYVWNREQVRGLFASLYRGYPIGGLLVWSTELKSVAQRGMDSSLSGNLDLLLDGQQRITTLYGVVRGKAPKFFDGNAQTFTGLQFHIEAEEFAFYQPMKMKNDPLWIDVTELMQKGSAGLGKYIAALSQDPMLSPKLGDYIGRLGQLLGILTIELHIEKVTGQEKTLEVVVEIFNKVNSGGTKLSQGDLALARICAEWSDARDTMKVKLKEWSDAGYSFNLDWLLRSVNTVLTGEAKFTFLHDTTATEIQEGLKRAIKHIDTCLNMIDGRLGLDHDQVFFGRFGIPVMVRYLDMRSSTMTAQERDKLLFWFVQAGMWGRFSGSTESYIDQDLAALEGQGDGLNRLLEQLRLWHGSLRVEPGHFTGWSLGARFYPVLYLMTRMGSAMDWGTGLPLRAGLLGKMNCLEVHHIFPKAQLYKHNYMKSQVNAVANFCFLTKNTNLSISDRLPEDYFPEVEKAHPGALRSQWIPNDPELWKVENFETFLEARKELLAAEFNLRMEDLLHGEVHWLKGTSPVIITPSEVVGGGLTSVEEEQELDALNAWMGERNLPRGVLSFDYADSLTGEQKAVLDIVWVQGIQEELSQPVALLLNESTEIIAIASQAGYRCFTAIQDFKRYVETEIIGEQIV